MKGENSRGGQRRRPVRGWLKRDMSKPWSPPQGKLPAPCTIFLEDLRSKRSVFKACARVFCMNC